MSGFVAKDDVRGRRALVLGASKSGLAAARLLNAKGADVFVSEFSDNRHVCDIAVRVESLGISVEIGGHVRALDFDPDFVVISPGIPLSAPIVQELKALEKPIFSEIEVGSWFFGGKIVAITGSNGKTTVTCWIEHILRTAGMDAYGVGNVGYAFCDMIVDHPDASHAVIEVSSYQLETIAEFRPDVALVTNISPDHLERHGGLEGYAHAKARVWMNQNADQWVVRPEKDEWVERITGGILPRQVLVSLDSVPDMGVGVEESEIFISLDGDKRAVMGIEDIPLSGMHNLFNALASLLAAKLIGVCDREKLVEGVCSFSGVEHRLELIGDNGRHWINDSKATNVDSLRVALEATDGPIWLIAGGYDKNASYKPLEDLVRDKVERLLLIGDGAPRFAGELGSCADVEMCGDMQSAVSFANVNAEEGVTVLLSPACASFDQYSNFEERGDHFRALVTEVLAQ